MKQRIKQKSGFIMKAINKPHDKFFKQSLSDITVAKDFLETHVPAKILAKFNLNEIELCKESYIDEDLEQLTDIVYRANINSGGKGYIYTLLEHQSKAITMMPLRIVKYQIAIIENHRLQFPDDPKLPVVFPLIFYHGVESPYPHSLKFLDLFYEPELMAEYFAKNINIVDLTQISDETIKQHKIISLLEYTQKHIRDRDFLLLFDELNNLLNKVCNYLTPTDQHLSYLNSLLVYLFSEANISDKSEFISKLETINIIKEHKTMGTLAQYFEEQGIQKSIEKGTLINTKKIVNNMLAKKLSLKLISEVTGLSSDELQKLRSKKDLKTKKTTTRKNKTH
jgi:predicted transposase/invertase (TIGR01784 family)